MKLVLHYLISFSHALLLHTTSSRAAAQDKAGGCVYLPLGFSPSLILIPGPGPNGLEELYPLSAQHFNNPKLDPDSTKRGGLLSQLSPDEGTPYPAHKAFGMPESVEGRDVVLQDGPGTAATLGCEHVKVILPAVGLAIFLMEP